MSENIVLALAIQRRTELAIEITNIENQLARLNEHKRLAEEEQAGLDANAERFRQVTDSGFTVYPLVTAVLDAKGEHLWDMVCGHITKIKLLKGRRDPDTLTFNSQLDMLFRMSEQLLKQPYNEKEFEEKNIWGNTMQLLQGFKQAYPDATDVFNAVHEAYLSRIQTENISLSDKRTFNNRNHLYSDM